MFSLESELGLRNSFVDPHQSLDLYHERVDEALMGYAYYIKGQRIKLQGNIGYKWFERLFDFDNASNSWTGLFQVEFGI